jgi:hypothetical protein
MGMLSKNGIRCLHLGQWEGGRKTDSPSGIRATQTLRKLPTIAPKKKTTVAVRAVESPRMSVIMPNWSRVLFNPYDIVEIGLSLV